MSYILEALKKSEKERQKEGIPGLQADHSLVMEKRRERHRRRPLLPWILLALLLVVLATSLAWWLFSSAPRVEVDGEVAHEAVTPPVVQEPAATPPPPTVQKPETPPPPPAEEVAAELPLQVKEQIAREVSEALARSPQPPVPPPSAEIQAEAESLVPLLEELPDGLQMGIPDLSFAGHAYSEEARERMIIINGRILRENDLVDEDLYLEEISANGVVMRFRDTVFRLELF